MTLLCGHTGDPALNAVYSSGLVPGAGGTVIIEERSQNCYCVLSSDSARHSNPIAPRYHPVCGFLQPHSAQWGGMQRLKRQDLAQGHTALRAGVHTEMSSRRLWVRCSSHHNTKSMVPSKGYLAVSGTLLVITSGKRCCWRLVGRGLRCCSISYHAQDSPAA